MIEADNYHALQLLEYLYAGKVDCIYIDPPYNTGAKDWKYNNDYVDSVDSYRHSKWLSMMQKRLKLAKKLLSHKDSIMVITIDEKEYIHSGCLLEEIFPEARIQMVSSVINPHGANRNDMFARVEEYLFFVFMGNAHVWQGQCDMLNPVEKTKRDTWARLLRGGGSGLRASTPNQFYPVKQYVTDLIRDGKYDELSQKVMEFQMKSQVFDVFGESMDENIIHMFMSTTDMDIDRQFRRVETRLGNEGVGNKYGHYLYNTIVSDGDIVSKHNFRLPETISLPREVNGKDYKDHLFVDDNGKARINLNTWEEGVLVEEQRGTDYVCWLRNPPRKPWSLCIPYEMGGEQKAAYPDFIIVRKDRDGAYVVDILEPHDRTRIDNLGKARGFAEYARQNPGVGRIQLIRMSKDAVGHDRFKRLDMSMSAVRDKVLYAMTNDQLDHIFETDGFFMDVP